MTIHNTSKVLFILTLIGKSSFKPKGFVSTKRPLELFHIDLFRPIKTTSLGGKNYDFVIVDDFSRFT
jgi:hypothetical protein